MLLERHPTLLLLHHAPHSVVNLAVTTGMIACVPYVTQIVHDTLAMQLIANHVAQPFN